MHEMTLKELKERAAKMENPEHRAIMEEALATLEADERAQEKKKRGRGRPRLQPGEHRVPKTHTFAPDVAEYLESLPNASAYLEAFVREEMEQEKAAAPIRTTIGAIAEHWGSEPSEWGLGGTVDVVEDPTTPARFELTEDGDWQLWVVYPDGSEDSPTQQRWSDEDVQGLREG